MTLHAVGVQVYISVRSSTKVCAGMSLSGLCGREHYRSQTEQGGFL